MGPTTLYTHLKIILLQCFQFSVFSFNNNKFNPNRPLVGTPPVPLALVGSSNNQLTDNFVYHQELWPNLDS